MQSNIEPAAVVEGLLKPAAYPHQSTQRVTLVETHISWVFLTDCFAYKVKKPIVNEFIDYRTLARRKLCCEREVELDRRYAPRLYVGVVPICQNQGHLTVEGDGKPVEYAVKMHRFDDEALLGHRLAKGLVTASEIAALADRIADFHRSASRNVEDESFGDPERIHQDQLQNLEALLGSKFHSPNDFEILQSLRRWTEDEFGRRQMEFADRKAGGWIRECHGDLHAGNIVHWENRLTPFDGIEFNEGFRWIDTLSDSAFLAMDLCVRGHESLSRQFISSYFEATGDYSAIRVLRWYLVYRALVRAKVASMVLTQHDESSEEFQAATSERSCFMQYAIDQTRERSPCLSIMHGLSGSGKSTHAANIVRHEAAIQIRADVERKRLIGLKPHDRLPAYNSHELYSSKMTGRTYDRLWELADEVLQAGYSVVVDATFLKLQQRNQFAELAQRRQVPFRIVHCQAELATLEQRIQERQGTDASDADLNVLQLQRKNQEPLTPTERRWVIQPPQGACSF